MNGNGIERTGRLGMRAQLALGLLGVLAVAATLTVLAVRPLMRASTLATRRRAGVTLSRAVAGQVALLPAGADLLPLLRDTVGPDALAGAAVLDDTGRVVARAGEGLPQPLPRPPYEDSVTQLPGALAVVVAVPGRGAFVADVSLAPTPAERALPLAVVLYAALASAAALWAAFVLLTRYTVRPVEALTLAAERVASGRREPMGEVRGAREVVRAVRAFNDMTAQLAARERELSARIDELERATRELEAAQDQLIRSERLAVVGRLAAGIAHEVGNPLAAIVGLTDVLKEGGLAEDEARDFADRIGREAQRIHRTVRELLDYARAAPTADARTDAAALEGSEPGDAGEAVAQVVRLLGPQKAMRGVDLSRAVAPGLPRVTLPTDRLVQVLLNLVLNAADAARGAHPDATPDAGGRGDASAGRVEVRAILEGERVVLEVEDDGPGVPPELRARVFEPFYTTKPAGQGTGLGLAICAVIVERAGGSITALPRRDGARGARFRVELPATGV